MSSITGLAQAFAVAAAGSRLPRLNWEIYVAGAAMLEWLADGTLSRGDRGKVEISAAFAPSSAGVGLAQTIRNARRPKTFKAWIQFLYSRTKLRRAIVSEIVSGLLDDRTLRFETKKRLGIFPVGMYSSDPAAKDRIVQQLRAELLEPGSVDERTAVLAMLLDSAKLLKRFFSDYERNEWQRKMERLQREKGEEWKRVTEIKKAIQEMEAAASSGAFVATVAT